MSTEETGAAAGPVILIVLAIAALLLGASVMPTLGDQSPGATVTSPDTVDEEVDGFDADGPDGQDEAAGIAGGGAGGAGGESEAPSEAFLTLAELLGPFDLPWDMQGQDGDELAEMIDEEDDDTSSAEDSDDEDGDDAAEENAEDSGDSSSDDEVSEDESSDDDREEIGEADSDDGFLDSLSSIGPYALGAIGAFALGVYLWRADVAVLTALRQLPGRLLSTAITVLIALSNQLERGIAALKRLESVAAFPGLVLGAIAGLFGEARKRAQSVSLGSLRGGTPTEDSTNVDETGSGGPESARAQIHDAWETLLRATPVARYRTAAPGEVARNAVDAGLPDTPVRTITEAFRDVEYGDIDPETHVKQTREARKDLETSLQDDEQSGRNE